MPAEPHGAAEIGPTPVSGPAAGCSGWLGRYGAVGAHADRADARAAAAVRDAERLVQVEVGHVAAEVARLGETDQGVEVGAVHVDLAARVVHLAADVGDVLLENTVRGGVGDHEDGELVAVLGDLVPEVRDVDLAVVGGLHHDDLHAGHHGARRVGAVRRGRDQTDRTSVVPVGAVVGAHGQQTGELALRAGCSAGSRRRRSR